MSREMKDSGVEWIGEIPKDWKVSKIKRIARIYTGNSIKDDQKENYTNYENSRPYIPTKAIDANNSIIDYDNGLYIPMDDTNFKIAKKGSILVCIEGGSAGKKIAYLNQDVCFVNKLCCFESVNFNNKYLYYYIKSPAFSNEFSLHISGLIGGVSQGEIKEFSIIIPSLLEQQKIANFLDKKVGEIDRLIDNAKKSIEEYKKYKQSIITEAVTKGLDFNVEMKDSGIEWIGEIPKNWIVIKLKYLSNIVRGGSPRPAGDLRYYDGPIPFMKISDITKDDEIYVEYCNSSIKESGLNSTRMVDEGTLLLTNSGATLGIPKINTFKTTFNDGIAAFLNLSKKIDIVFCYFYLKSKQKYFLEEASMGMGQPNLNTDIIGNTYITLPPILEQKSIVNYLERTSNKINNLISKKEKLISGLESYKKSLIYEYVTGKRIVE